MQFFKQLTDPALKRLYKFVLKRLIGRFLAEDEIDLDQLDVHLGAGRLELCDLLLNADVLNAELCEANGLPFRVKKGYLGSVRVTISYTNIMSESCLVEIDDIEIVLVPVDDAEDRELRGQDATAGGATTTASATAHTDQGGSTPQKNPTVTKTEPTDEVSQEGLDFVASWIEQVTSKIKVTLSNICLRLETEETVTVNGKKKGVALLCKLEWAQFTDESASEVASVYGRASLDQSMHQSMAASTLFGISQKAIKFRGISMDLALPAEEYVNDHQTGDQQDLAVDSVIHPFLASDSTRQCYVQLKVSHYEAIEAPALDADLFLHSIRVVLQPQHFPHFGTLMDAFSPDEIQKRPTRKGTPPMPSMYESICDTRPKWLSDDCADNTTQAGNAKPGDVQLSFREFQRIEQLLQHYHRTHEELRQARRSSSTSNVVADFPYPMQRRLSIAESVESVGLSDLDDEENFFDCEPGTESITGQTHFGSASMIGNPMAQSMYASALYDHPDTRDSLEDGHASTTASMRHSVPGRNSIHSSRAARSVRNRVKVHLLECDVVLLYDDLPDHHDEDDEDTQGLSSRQLQLQRRRRKGLPQITDQERLEFVVKDLICSTLSYQTHVSVSFTIGTFEIVEKTLARMSTGVDSLMLAASVLRFVDTSPATGRKVHLSANISAQLRIDLKPESPDGKDAGGVESLALQVSAQPIVLEWDMYLLDRAHRLVKLMEESSAAKQKKANSRPAPANDVPVFPKRLDVNTECVEITLRFPMVNSDLIRFGPSSTRGLSEDKLVLTLNGVKASSYADGAEKDEGRETTKLPLPWLAEFAVGFDTVTACLIAPPSGNQRALRSDKHVLLTGRGDSTSGDRCYLRLRVQTPSAEDIRLASNAKQAIAQDSLEYIESRTPPTFSVDHDDESKSGDDNDGGRVGSNGWNQDARARALAFEEAASRAALTDMDIMIPQSAITLPKAVFDRLMILFDALLAINPIDINGHNQMMASVAYRNRLVPSYMSMSVLFRDGTLQLMPSPSEQTELTCQYHLAFQDLRIFQIGQWMGQLVSRVHVSTQNVSLLEENVTTKEVQPVLYRNPIGVSDAPLLFVGVDIIDQTQEMREMKVELHCSTLSLRYDVTSTWMMQLADVLVLEYPSPIIPLDSASTTEDEYQDLLEQIQRKQFETVKLAVPPKTVFTKLFVSFYDAVLDYSPSTLPSRVMLVLGNVSVSSNVVSGAMIQGYKIAVRDIQLYLTPEGPTYDELDEHILGNELFLRDRNPGTKGKSIRFGDGRSRGNQTSLYPSLLMFFEKHGFLQMVTMDVIDVFLRAIVPIEPSKIGTPMAEQYKPAVLGSPELSVELTLGTANIYACFDSFNTLIELLSVWGDQLSVEAEPRDTAAYVGLDRVKDVSSVSVVTNLGPRNLGTSLEDGSPLAITGAGSNAIVGSVDADRSTSFRSASRASFSGRRARGASSDGGSFDVEEKPSGGMNIFSQIDENAFGSSRKLFPGKHVATDTEARLLQTRLDSIQKEKERMMGGTLDSSIRDDLMSGSELRQKYKPDEQSTKPRLRINELVIEDYYTGKRSGTNAAVDHQNEAAGAFLLAGDDVEQSSSLPSPNPWFANTPPTQQATYPGDLHPVGSLPEEHAARWLPADSARTNPNESTTSSPRFDPVDEEALSRELSTLEELSLDNDDDVDEDDALASTGYPSGPKRWWATTTRGDVELSEFQTEETESMFSHQLHFMDDESDATSTHATHPSDDHARHPLSMSIIGTGDDAGTEVELDFALDREMQFNFNRLMEIEANDDREAEEELEEDEVDEAEGHYVEPPSDRLLPPINLSAPMPIPTRSSSGSYSVPPAATATVPPAAMISPPDEPTARWFYDERNDECMVREGPPSRIYPHHVEIPIGGTAASLSFGERECDEAIRSIARENAALKQPASAPVVIRHVLLRDFNICMRFFGGSDWSRDNSNAPTLTHRGVMKGVEPNPRMKSSLNAATVNEGAKKEKLLDALLDNYVPSSTGSNLFGNDENESSSVVRGAKSLPVRSFASDSITSNSTRTTLSASAPATRKRSLKTGRKTEEMLELVITRIQLRIDMFNDDENQPLASNVVVALGDIEILDYISTSQIRKIICYWKSEVSHPRESGSSMVHVHLMTVRPGPNLCEEHRLKMKILPLRVNLDQEVVNFLRQFVPVDNTAGRNNSTSAVDETHNDDEEDKPFVSTGMDGTEMSIFNAPSPSHVRETDVALGNWFFQSIEIRPCKIKIDYRPNRVDYQALRAGDYLEVINLFVLEGMELVLRRVKASGIDGWAAMGEHVLMSWVNDISRHQIHKCVASVSMPPLRSFANIGSGAADLILLPMEHYGKDRRIVRGIKKGAKSFLKSVTIETLNTASKVAQGTQALLEHADDVVSSTASRSKKIKYRQPGSRIARNSKRMGGGGIRSALQDHGGIGSRQYLAQQPSNATEGFYQAYDSLSRELHVAAKTIVAVPLVEYKKTGSHGYVRSVIRAVPVAVLRPMIGATEAVSKALIGVRNAVDPELKEDVENKFKDFRTI